MTTISTLSPAMKLHRAVDGKTEILLAQHRREGRMVPLLRYHRPDGSEHIIELSTADVVPLMQSLVVMFAADEPRVAGWWKALTGRDV